jgi:hypothetical protein
VHIASLLFLAVLFDPPFPGLVHAGDRFGGGTRSITSGRISNADDLRFADPAHDDASWPETSLYELPRAKQALWIRQKVSIAEDEFDGKPLGLYVSALASVQVYWDGELAGSSGIIDDRGRAVAAGPIDNFFLLDGRRRAPGEHMLAIRLIAPPESSRVRYYVNGIALGDYAFMVRSRVAHQIIPVAGLGVFIVIGVYYVSLWLAAGRRRSMLVFALLCFVAALLVVAETYRWLFGYTYDWHLVRLNIVIALTAAISLLLPLFFVLELEVKKGWILLAALAASLVAAVFLEESSDTRCLMMFWCGVGASAIAIGAALPRKRWQVLPAAAGIAILAITLLRGGYFFGDHSFFLAFCALILCLLISLTLQTGRQQRERDQAVLRAARLEIELLKRSIQPHFLMNTLTAVMEWIEENPRQGVRFLEALAAELRIFGEVAGQPLITVARELDLCRSHLTIMGCRKGASFDLETSGIDGAALIPPAIFHTLIENAITHNGYAGDRVTFRLEELREGLMRRYTLTTPASKREHPAVEGLGLKYVKARLEEMFPGRWRVESRGSAGQWTTTIEVGA